MAGNPYNIGGNNNPQTQNRLSSDGTYPILANQPYPAQQPYQPNQQQPYPYNQPNYSNQPPNHPNQQPYPLPPQQQQQWVGTLCPSCNQMTQSYTKRAVGAITWIWCLGLWICTGICCWIPFVCDDCKEEQIRCGKCHAKKAIL